MKINWKKDILPHAAAVVIFIILGFIYCHPVLQGDKVNQSDMTQVEGMAHESKVFYEKTHQRPLWTNSMFGGMPSYLIYTGPPPNKVSFLNSLTRLWLPSPVNMLFIAMLGMYFLLWVFGLRYWVRLFGGVAYGFSSYNVILITAGHITKLMTMAWMAPVLAGVILVYRGKYLLGAVVTAFATALLIYNNHFQVIYYMLIMLVFLVVSRLVIALREKQLKRFIVASLICVGCGILAALPSAGHLMITREFTKYSTRGSHSELTLANQADTELSKGGLSIGYAYQWSFGKLETFSILVPNIYGGPPPSQDFAANSHTTQVLSQLGMGGQQAAAVTDHLMYWGPQPFTTPVYFGALICFLFILSFFLVRSKHKWWILAVTLVSILMAWGKNFGVLNDFLFYHLPLYQKFRAPSMMMVVPQLTFVWMGCWALNEVLVNRMGAAGIWNGVKKSLYITVGLLVFIWIAPAMIGYAAGQGALAQKLSAMFGGGANPQMLQQLTEKIGSAVRADRASLLHKDIWRSLILVLLLVGALWALITKKIKPLPFFAIASVLLLFDLFQVDSRYLNSDNYVPSDEYAQRIQPTEADRQILRDTDPDYRVLNLSADVFNDAITSYFHKSVGGYSPAKLWRYQDLIDYQIAPDIQRIISGLQGKKSLDSSALAVFGSSPVLNLLNTKYFIVNPNGAPVENKKALGNAWFVSRIHWAASADSEMTAMSGFNPAETAVLNGSYKKELAGFSPSRDTAATISLTRYSLNDLQYASASPATGLAVFSEIYYPAGWEAYIDGKQTPILRVDYAFRGLVIPAGKHLIEFRFHPKTYFTGAKISSVSSVLLIILVLAGLIWAFYLRMGAPVVRDEVKMPEKTPVKNRK